jgi:hypothetical protein
MDLILVRRYKKETYTIGQLSYIGLSGKNMPLCNTCEDKVRNIPTEPKVPGETAIPAGRYKVTLQYSPHFKRELPYLHDVPYFEGILIHAGNSAKDSKGCILVGENKVKGGVVNSRFWEAKITEMIREEEENYRETFITIR